MILNLAGTDGCNCQSAQGGSSCHRFRHLLERFDQITIVHVYNSWPMRSRNFRRENHVEVAWMQPFEILVRARVQTFTSLCD